MTIKELTNSQFFGIICPIRGGNVGKHKNYSFNYCKEEYDKIMEDTLLNNKEKKCLEFLIQGLTCKQIGKKLGCSERTIQNRRRDIFHKLNTNLFDQDIKEKKYCIYILIFPNKKYYVGKSINPKKRWGNQGDGYTNNKKMYEDIVKYGWENIQKKILYRNLCEDEAKYKENETIVIYKSYMEEYGYNKSITS